MRGEELEILEKGRGKCRREGGMRWGRHGLARAASREVSWKFHARIVLAELVLQGCWAGVSRTVQNKHQSHEWQQEQKNHSGVQRRETKENGKQELRTYRQEEGAVKKVK